MDLKRTLAVAVLGATGVGLLVIAGTNLGATGTLPGVALVGATLLLGAAFGISGPLLYTSEVDSDHLLRVAGWSTLGVVATVAVLTLVAVFQETTGGTVTAPLLSGGIIVAVSTFAHLLIGFNDVRRIRARTVARQRQKAAVINRFVRHDLSHAAQLLYSYGGQLRAEGDGEIGGKVNGIGEDLAETKERIKIIDDLLEQSPETRRVEIEEILDREREEWGSEYPEGDLDVDIEDGIAAMAGEHVDRAVGELIENAFEHGGDPPAVSVRGQRSGGSVELEILDNGDGHPEEERELINEDRKESQLHHSSGLGLWIAKWIIEYYDGELSVGAREGEAGGRATVRLPAVIV